MYHARNPELCQQGTVNHATYAAAAAECEAKGKGWIVARSVNGRDNPAGWEPAEDPAKAKAKAKAKATDDGKG